MDLQMPDIDGLEATRRIRTHARMQTLPIIAMTANAMGSDKDACLAAGMVDHVSKPIDLDQLIATLLRHTGRGDHAPQPEPPHDTPPAEVEQAIDLHTALARLGGDFDLYTQIAQLFQADAVVQMDELQRYLAHEQHSDAARCAHTLKGLAGTLGANALAAACAQLESALKAKPPAAPGLLGQVQTQLSLSLVQLEALTAAAAAPTAQAADLPTPADLDLSALAPALRELSGLLQDSNMRSTVVSAQLREQFGSTLGEPFAQLDHAIQQLNFGAALAHCQALLDTWTPQKDAL